MTHPKLVCQYCDKPCSRNPTDTSEWTCKQCYVRYLILDDKIASISFKTKVKNNKYYTIHLSLTNNDSRIYLWTKVKPYPIAKLIFAFDHIINITPTNLQFKLKTYLLLL